MWAFDLANDLISIGWSQLGDASTMTHEQLVGAVATTYLAAPLATRTLYANMLWNFYHEIVPGDVIIARRGRRVLAAVGTVVKPASYAPGRNPHLENAPDVHASYLPVKWQALPRDKQVDAIVFPMYTLAEFTEEQYLNLVGPITSDAELRVSAQTIEDQGAFVLERYLEDFIVNNFSMIFGNQLSLYCDEQGADGQQYNTDIGIIDTLAFERTTNSFVVIELKKGRPSDQVVGRVLRYMGWVKEKLCGPNQNVKGLVICRDQDQRMVYALSMVPNVKVKYYAVSFRLGDTP